MMINNLAAVRQGDQVFEACGGPDPIAMGCPTVIIGDAGGGGAGGAGGAPETAAAAAGAAVAETIQKVETIENAFSQAAINGLPLIDRSKDCPCKGI